MSVPSFDLVSAPWLPVVRVDGSTGELSLSELFEQVNDVEDIAAESPLITFAIHRILLAIVHRVVGGPHSAKHWTRLWKEGLPVDEVCRYLEEWRARFDLFHADHPFFQVPDFATVDKKGQPTEPAPVTVLRPEFASGNNAVLNNHATDPRPEGLTPAGAARALLGAHAFALGGGKGPRSNAFGEHPYASHATQVGGVVALLRGKSLGETLLLNMLIINDSEPVPRTGEDRPVWESAELRKPGKVTPLGYLDYLTLPCRAVRLVPERTERGAWCVRRAYVAPGCAVEPESGVMSPAWALRRDKKGKVLPLALRAERAIWRDASALLALVEPGSDFDPRPAALRQAETRKVSKALGADGRLMIRCYGLVNDKAKAIAWRTEELPARVRVLDDPDLLKAVAIATELAEEVARAVDWGFRKCASTLLTTPDKSADPSDITRLATRMNRHAGFWDGLERSFRELLLSLDAEHVDGSLFQWASMLGRRAEESFRRGSRFAQGPTARRLEAVVVGEAVLRARLRKLRAPFASSATVVQGEVNA